MLARVLIAVLLFSTAAHADDPPPPETPPSESPVPAPAAVPAPAVVPAPVLSSTSPAEETIPRPKKRWGFVFGGAAISAFVIGGALGGTALARANEQSGNPTDPPLYTHALQDRANEGKNMAATAYVFYGLGTACAIIDAIIWYEIYRKAPPKKSLSSAITPSGIRF